MSDLRILGVKSTARSIVAPNGRGAPKFTGYAVYRATVDVAKMREIPEISWVLEQPSLNLWSVISLNLSQLASEKDVFVPDA